MKTFNETVKELQAKGYEITSMKDEGYCKTAELQKTYEAAPLMTYKSYTQFKTVYGYNDGSVDVFTRAGSKSNL